MILILLLIFSKHKVHLKGSLINMSYGCFIKSYPIKNITNRVYPEKRTVGVNNLSVCPNSCQDFERRQILKYNFI